LQPATEISWMHSEPA